MPHTQANKEFCRVKTMAEDLPEEFELFNKAKRAVDRANTRLYEEVDKLAVELTGFHMDSTEHDKT